MKAKKLLLVSILLLVFLTACQQNDALITHENNDISETNESLVMQDSDDKSDVQDNNKELQEGNLDVKYNYTVKGETSDDFYYLISSNPIDLMQKEHLEDYDGSSRMLVEIASKYEGFWYREMEVAYNQLLRVLDEEDKQNLISSQTSWESYMESKKHIEQSFYYEHKYDVVGTLRTGLSVEETADETKARAYSLLEYLYIITGEINMVFSSDEW